MTQEATVSISWVKTVLNTAQQLGVESSTLLNHAGIDPQTLQKNRWPVDHITRLWWAAVALTKDPCFGLNVGAHVSPASLNTVSFVAYSSASLRDALSNVQKYQRLISDGGRFQLVPGIEGSWLIYHPRQGELSFSPHQIEAVLSALVIFSRQLVQRPQRPQCVRFTHVRIGPFSAYNTIFDCPIEFEQAFNGVLLDNQLLDAPLPQADPQLAQVQEHYVRKRLEELSESDDLPNMLEKWLNRFVSTSLPTRTEAAKYLNLTERTLARRLQSVGLSFSTMLDNALRYKALTWIEQPDIPIADIALRLGYSDFSPFYRAFFRWTGTTPGRWRSGYRPRTSTKIR